VFAVSIVAGSCMNRCDWAGLPPLVVENVVGRLLDRDMADFTWFLVVSKVWMDGSDTKKPVSSMHVSSTTASNLTGGSC